MSRVHPLILALAQIRHRAGVTQRAVAAKAYVSHKTISNWETGRSHPSLVDIAAFADALGYDLTLTPKSEDGRADLTPEARRKAADALLAHITSRWVVCDHAQILDPAGAVDAVVDALNDTEETDHD